MNFKTAQTEPRKLGITLKRIVESDSNGNYYHWSNPDNQEEALEKDVFEKQGVSIRISVNIPIARLA
jgi:hypothetical protein